LNASLPPPENLKRKISDFPLNEISGCEQATWMLGGAKLKHCGNIRHYTRDRRCMDSAFRNLIGCSALDILALFTSGQEQNVFLFCAGYTDEQIFLLNEVADPSNTKKAPKFCLTVLSNESKFFLVIFVLLWSSLFRYGIC
jgi:hypothetical protein